MREEDDTLLKNYITLLKFLSKVTLMLLTLKALGQELRWQRSRYRSWLLSTVASATITFSANDFSIDGRFDFDLLAVVTMAEVFKWLAAASTDQGAW